MLRILSAALALTLVASQSARAADPAGGDWKPLFNGADFSGWDNGAGKAPAAGWAVEQGAITRKGPGGYVWTKKRFGDFVLDLEFKTEGNSGVFIRTGSPRDPVQTGLEIQVLPPAGKPNKNSCGSIYDCLAPTKEATKKDQWNRMVVTAKANRIQVVMNGQPIIDMDLDRWSEPGKNPDGSKNKYKKAVKDFPREGHIGLQDHGAKVSYRNIKLKTLD